jgi:hypothetical protein
VGTSWTPAFGDSFEKRSRDKASVLVLGKFIPKNIAVLIYVQMDIKIIVYNRTTKLYIPQEIIAISSNKFKFLARIY